MTDPIYVEISFEDFLFLLDWIRDLIELHLQDVNEFLALVELELKENNVFPLAI